MVSTLRDFSKSSPIHNMIAMLLYGENIFNSVPRLISYIMGRFGQIKYIEKITIEVIYMRS